MGLHFSGRKAQKAHWPRDGLNNSSSQRTSESWDPVPLQVTEDAGFQLSLE
jgi:hypothetical protein